MRPEKRPKTQYVVVAAPKKAAKRPKRAPRQCRRASFEFPDLDPLPGVQLDLPGFEDMPQFTTPDFPALDPIPTMPELDLSFLDVDMPPVPDIPLLLSGKGCAKFRVGRAIGRRGDYRAGRRRSPQIEAKNARFERFRIMPRLPFLGRSKFPRRTVRKYDSKLSTRVCLIGGALGISRGYSLGGRFVIFSGSAGGRPRRDPHRSPVRILQHFRKRRRPSMSSFRQNPLYNTHKIPLRAQPPTIRQKTIDK